MNWRTLAAVLLSAIITAIPASAGDDYYQTLERRLEQMDRDRQNYSWPDDSEYDVYYAAIAYSPKTGKYGYSYSHGSLAAARTAALQHCPEKDARIVGWAQNNYCALAEGDDGFGCGFGGTPQQARAMALRECAKQTTGGKVVVCVFSGR